jgi:hypothetical protein
MLTHFAAWQLLAVVLGILSALVFAWRAHRAAWLRRAAEIRADLSDAVLEEDSLPWPPVQRLTGERLDRAREIVLTEREILWASSMLTRCDPEVEGVWVRALKAGQKRLQRLKFEQITSGPRAVPPQSEACRSANHPAP